MPTPGNGAIGALDWTEGERKKLAGSSPKWSCSVCGRVNSETLLPVQEASSGSDKIREESEKYAAELKFSADKKSSTSSDSTTDNKSPTDKSTTTDKTPSPSTEPTASDITSGDVIPPQEQPSSPSNEVPTPPAAQNGVPGAQNAAPAGQNGAGQTTPPVAGSATPAVQGASGGGGFCSLFLIYLLAGLISALFLRRVMRSVYDELWTENPFD